MTAEHGMYFFLHLLVQVGVFALPFRLHTALLLLAGLAF
jgi:hypothetical protein